MIVVEGDVVGEVVWDEVKVLVGDVVVVNVVVGEVVNVEV